MTKSPTAAARRGGRRAPSTVQVVRLHPSIRSRLGPVDMRRVSVLRVEDGLAVDVIVRNT